MNWFKRLFGLGANSARISAAGSADGYIAEPDVPSPPAGFTWHRFEKARMMVLRPDGWYVHQVGDEQAFTGCVSRESIPIEGSFKTGLTLHVYRGVLPDGLFERDPDAAIVGMVQARYPGFFSDACNKILYVDEVVQRTSHSRLWRLEVRQSLPGKKVIIIHKFLIIFDQSSDFYDFTFESPESSWNKNWQKGKQILTNLAFSVDPATNMMFSADPALPPDDVLEEKLLEVGRALGWSLAYADRSEGLFIWSVPIVAPNGDASRPIGGCFSWYMKRVHNEIWVNDPVQLDLPGGVSSLEVMEKIGTAASELQADFKRRWLTLVGPVTLRAASEQTHSIKFQVNKMVDILGKREK